MQYELPLLYWPEYIHVGEVAQWKKSVQVGSK